MELVRLAGRPELTVRLAGEDFHFSELTLGALADLQAWIKANAPRPLDDLDDHLGDIWPGFHARLAVRAHEAARGQAPQIGTPAGGDVLNSYPGRIETIYRGLLRHHLDATRDRARGFYRAAKGVRNGKLLDRVFSTLFNVLPDPPPGSYEWALVQQRGKASPRSQDADDGRQWNVIYRAAAQRLKFDCDRINRHTISQLVALLDEGEGDGGVTSLNSFSELEEIGELMRKAR